MDPTDISLRPTLIDDFWLFERQAVDPEAAGNFNWSGYRDIAALKRRFEEDGLIGAAGGCLIVLSEKMPIGTVVWNRTTYGMPAWWCWNIGISLLPEHRGKGAGTAAQRLLVTYLFETMPIERIEAYTDTQNVAEQRSLKKVGFHQEGILRSVQFREGRWRDVVIYSLLRHEYQKHR